MLFTSYEFIAFLAIVFVLYYVVPKRAQWPLLLAFSYVFYYLADPRYLIFILVTTISTYLISIQMEKVNDAQNAYLAEHKQSLSREEKKSFKAKMKAKKWRFLLVCLLLNIGILAVTKYTNFVINNINSFLSGTSKLALVDMIVPMGISFYTFQTMGYIIDVYRGKQEAQKNPFKLALFVSFFPQLVQGPISRYGDLSETLFSEHRFDGKTVTFGLFRILWGYFKKVVIADRIITAVTTLVGSPEQYTGTYVFIAMLFYAFELYCDFTGGIDITIGIAEVMGIRVAENFNLPYFSKSIKEYWNRWHITMGTWFTDYIFYPISVSGPMLKLSKWSRTHLGDTIGKRVPVYLSSFVVWFATGIWHGAAWNFIVWGLMNFVVIMISQELEPLYAKFHNRFAVQGKAPWEAFRIVRTILLMSCIRMFDCYRNVPLTFQMVGTMFTSVKLSVFTNGSLMELGISQADYLVLVIGFFVVLGVSLYKYHRGPVREALYAKPAAVIYGVMGLLFVTILIFGAYGAGYDSSQFIYNQF
jgi:D-alanyl-lipoteichoic acid acyltransferase DltB (MBOAT superfamily)